MRLLKHIINFIALLPLLAIGQNNVCFGDDIIVSTANYNSSAGFTQNFVLVDNDGNILDYNTTGIFGSSSYGTSSSNNFNLYAVNTDESNLMLTANNSTWSNFEDGIASNDLCARFIGPRSFNIISKDTTNETYTSCNDFVWDVNGSTYTESTTDYVTLTNVNGCDSVVRLNLTISNESNISTVEACDSYDWNGTSYTTSGTYTFQSGTCEDSLFLTINSSFTSLITETECNSYTWDLNNTSYNISGTYVQIEVSENGCDSTVTLDLTIIDCEVEQVCSGESLISPASGYNLNYDQYYILSDSLTDEIISINTDGEFLPIDYDEDNLRTLALYAINTNEAVLSQIISNADFWTEIEYSADSKCADILGPKYFEIIPCCELSVISSITNESCYESNDGELELTISGNSSYNVLINDNSFGTNTSPGDYQYPELSPNTYEVEVIDNNFENCDTSIFFNIIAAEPIDTTPSYPLLCFGDSILINGTYYGASKPTGFETLLSSSGCDSVIEIVVSERTEIKTGLNPVVCYGENVVINNTVYNADNPSGYDTLTSIDGCDSILIINLDLKNQIINDDTIQLCMGGSINIGGVIYDGNNSSVEDTLQSINGCDSILAIKIIEVDKIVNDIEKVICFGDSIEINGNYYSAINPTGSDTLTAAIGCDSIININVTEIGPITSNYVDSVCAGDSVLINGNYYSLEYDSGVDTLVSFYGCDSLVTVSIIEKASYVSSYIDTICPNDTLVINNNLYYSGKLTGSDTLQSIYGCDSIVNVSLTMGEQIVNLIQDTLCYGGSVVVNGNTYSGNNPIGQDTLQSVNGCDSIIRISIFENPEVLNVIDTNLCYGGFFIINGTIYNSFNSTGTEIFTDQNGCDSILQITVTELEEINETISDTLCYGDSIIVNGVVYNGSNNSGTETILSTFGCDSTINISVFERSQISSFINETICENDTFYFQGSTFYSGNEFGQIILQSVEGCDSTINISINTLDVPNIYAELVVNFDSVYNLIDLELDTVCDFDTLQFYGLGGSNYTWDNDINNGDTVLYPFDEFYSLIGTDDNGCSNTFEFDLFIDEYCIDFSLDTSNVFTPDGDGYNDIFLMGGESFETNSLQIYNRWGQLIFESYNGSGWDGRLQSGVEAEPGTYLFITTIQPITRQTSEILNIQGYLKLIR